MKTTAFGILVNFFVIGMMKIYIKYMQTPWQFAHNVFAQFRG